MTETRNNQPRTKNLPTKKTGQSTMQYTYNGETKSLAKWARQYSLPVSALKGRMKMGWEMGRALTTPVRVITGDNVFPILVAGATRYYARIRVAGKSVPIAAFDRREDAVAAVVETKKALAEGRVTVEELKSKARSGGYHKITAKGLSMTVAGWARYFGVTPSAIHHTASRNNRTLDQEVIRRLNLEKQP